MQGERQRWQRWTKARSPQQWDTDPCGAVTAAPVTPESAECMNRCATPLRRLRSVAAGGDGYRRWGGADVLNRCRVGSDHLGLPSRRAHARADLSAEHLRHTQRHLAFTACRPRRGWVTPNAIRGRTAASISSILRRAASHPWHRGSSPGGATVLRPGGTALIGLYHRIHGSIGYGHPVCGIVRLGLLRKGKRRLLSRSSIAVRATTRCRW